MEKSREKKILQKIIEVIKAMHHGPYNVVKTRNQNNLKQRTD